MLSIVLWCVFLLPPIFLSLLIRVSVVGVLCLRKHPRFMANKCINKQALLMLQEFQQTSAIPGMS